MDPFIREFQLRQQFEQNRVLFLLTELDVTTTFCEVAKGSNNLEKTKRNVTNARTGYDTLLKFRDGVHFDANQKREFDRKFSHLKSLLRELGQDV